MIADKDESVCILIRYATAGDMERIGEIEEESFIECWLPEVVQWSVKRKHATAIVAEYNCEIVGYAIYQLEGPKENAVIRVARLAVAEHARRCGVGGCLLDALLDRLTLNRRTLVFPVRESNLVAQVWLREYGLTCREIVEGYYADEEPAYLFEVDFEEVLEWKR